MGDDGIPSASDGVTEPMPVTKSIGMSPGLAGLFAPITLYPASTSAAAGPMPFCAQGENARGGVVRVHGHEFRVRAWEPAGQRAPLFWTSKAA